MEEIRNNYFYTNIPDTITSRSEFISILKEYSNTNRKQVYVLNAPLTDNKYKYDFKDGYFVLIPGKRIVFINICGDENNFQDYVEDVIEDVWSISDKYDFSRKLGRRRTWQNEIYSCCKEDDLINSKDWMDYFTCNSSQARKADVLISLCIGSINDAESIELDQPSDLLTAVKQKIILFDTDQTRFIYNAVPIRGNKITIQGLSGTGKTELLMHKVKNLYLEDDACKIFFTCHNHVLADSLNKRIRSFFNQMRVTKQIDWDSRLWCTNAWGSASNPNSGLLSYICNWYGIPFMNLQQAGRSFEAACKYVLKYLKNNNLASKNKALTYIIIDESQDFNESFFDLCQLVAEKNVYIAGDIFQNIFQDPSKVNESADFILSKCYRTDPKTLMLAQALGMGLFEQKKFGWLDDRDWKLCGYQVERAGNRIMRLFREPIRRFEDLGDDFDSFRILAAKDAASCIISQIKELQCKYPSIQPGDVGIVMCDKQQYIYECSVYIGNEIKSKLGWDFNLAHETREKYPDKLFISNRNHVKGLEFPFVFCVTRGIVSEYFYRNTLYTMLSRSFLRSYLIVIEPGANVLDPDIIDGAMKIRSMKQIEFTEPTEEEKADIIRNLKIAVEEKPLRDRIEDIMKSENVNLLYLNSVIENAEKMGLNLQEMSKEQILSIAYMVRAVNG